MKWLPLILLILSTSICKADNLTTNELLLLGKKHYKSATKSTELDSAIYYLEKCISKDSLNQEAWYFLGYAYSRKQSFYGDNIIEMTLEGTIKASDCFLKVIEIDSVYVGEVISQDPYFKICSEWGCLAIKYIYYNQLDSAKWAFEQAMYDDYTLAYNRSVLESCTKNSILFVFGDSESIPKMYLQFIEGVRKDVSVVDASLIHTAWAPEFYRERCNVSFSYTKKELANISYMVWEDSTITLPINKKDTMSWTLKPTSSIYLERGARLQLDILKYNNFKRDVFYTIAIPLSPEYGLFIPDKYLYNCFNIYQLAAKKPEGLTKRFRKNAENYIVPETDKRTALKYKGTQVFIHYLRYSYLVAITDYIDNDEPDTARKLFATYKEKLSEDICDYYEEKYVDYVKNIEQQLY